MCSGELQCVAVCCSVLQCVAVSCSVLQCVAVCCSVLQCVATHVHSDMLWHAYRFIYILSHTSYTVPSIYIISLHMYIVPFAPDISFFWERTYIYFGRGHISIFGENTEYMSILIYIT